MQDFVTKIREEQEKLALKYVGEFVTQAIEDVAKWSPGTLHLKDNLTARGVAFQPVYHEVLKSICAYTNWLARRLTRSKNFTIQTPPVCDKKSLARLASRYRITAGTLQKVIARLTQSGTKLPVVGEIAADGRLIPDRVALEQWASLRTKPRITMKEVW